MEMSARRLIRINLGNYEHVEVERTITGIPEGTPPGDIDTALDDLMAGDITRARDASGIPESDNDTSVYEWHTIMGGQ